MPARTPPVWCADLTVVVDPLAKGADCTPQGDAYPRNNGIWDAKAGAIRLAGAANEVLAFQLVVEKRAGRLEAARLDGADGVELSVHQNISVPVEERWVDDPVVPIDLDAFADSSMATSKKAPKVKGRRRQTFTLELYVPKGTAAGEREMSLIMRLGGEEVRTRLLLTVYGFELPDENACTGDINNYSRVPFAGGVDADTTSDEYIATMNAYFRMARDHRMLFHLLPYNQSGRLGKGYAPILEGRGKNLKVTDWSSYDRTWGGLLDGSVFKGSRCGEHPLEIIYAPVNLQWPAHFENYGRPGFKVEYQNFLREMAAHASQKGWTRTHFEVFFNHKARWKYFPWDMDEIYYERDNYATIEFGKWATEAVADHKDVSFINRIDSSWIFGESAKTEMADCIQLWVVNRGCHGQAPDEVASLHAKGQKTWFYGGSGRLANPDRLDNLKWPWVAWGREAHGFCWWNGTGWGTWENPGAGGGHCFYAGDRFGINGPLASVRLKATHRGLQDHAYLTLLDRKTGSRAASDAILTETIQATDRESWYQREEETDGTGSDIAKSFRTGKAWNDATLDDWDASRTRLAAAIEKA
jgi:hypothetical protein